MSFLEWSCEICKEPYTHSRALEGHIKGFHKTKQNHWFILCEIMFTTNTNSEEYLKLKTKFEWKI